MPLTLENKPELGFGIYTVPDIAQILRLPYSKVNRWIKNYWDKDFGESFGARYSWTDGKSIAISFHTLIEMYTFYQFTHAGVRIEKIVEAHRLLANRYQTKFPFATTEILNHIDTDGRKIFWDVSREVILNLDPTFQFNLSFVRNFFLKIDFNGGSLAARLWPLGKEKSIVVDPSHQFGQAVVEGTNINPETLFELYEAGEETKFIASLYGLDEKQIQDALDFCKNAA